MIFIGVATDTVDVTASVSASTSAPVLTTWPVNYPNGQASGAISNTNTTWTTTAYINELKLMDLAFQQPAYPTQSWVEGKYDDVTGVKALSPVSGQLKVLLYTAPSWAKNAAQPNSVREYYWDLIVSNNADPAWLAQSTTGERLISGENSNSYWTNMADHLVPTRNGKTYYQAYWDDYTNRLSGAAFGSAKDFLSSLDGVFFDTMDIKDNRPDKLLESDGVTEVTADYDQDGSTADSQVNYRVGINRWIDLTEATRSDFAVFGNGGSDGLQYRTGGITTGPNVSDLEWYQQWGGRYSEGTETTLGLMIEDKALGNGVVDAYYVRYTNRVPYFYQDGSISLLLTKPSASHPWGRSMALMDCELARRGSTPYLSNLTADDYAFGRFYWALCQLTEDFLFMPGHTGSEPTVRFDETLVDLGSPLSTRSMGTLSADGTSFALRSADDNGFYWAEFANALVIANLNAPSVGTWPQAATDTCTLPSAGTGKKWQRLNAATYVSPVYGMSCRSQDTAVNDGSDQGSTLTLRRYHGLLLLRVDE